MSKYNNFSRPMTQFQDIIYRKLSSREKKWIQYTKFLCYKSGHITTGGNIDRLLCSYVNVADWTGQQPLCENACCIGYNELFID